MQALFLQILSLALCTNGAENLQTSLQAFVLQKQIVNCIDLVALGTNWQCLFLRLQMYPFQKLHQISSWLFCIPRTLAAVQLSCAADWCFAGAWIDKQAGLGLSFLRGRKDTGLCVSIICLKRDETLSNYFSSNPDASNHSDHVYGPVHTWQNFCFLLQSLMRFLGLWVIPCSPPTSSSTNRLFSKSIILGTQPTYLNEASTYYK